MPPKGRSKSVDVELVDRKYSRSRFLLGNLG